MDNCLVTNFYRSVLLIASHDSHASSTSTALFNPDVISLKFVATSITAFAVLFATTVLYYVTTRTWKMLRAAYDFLFVPLNRIMPLGSVGYMNHESHDLSQRQLVNLVRRRRKFGQDLPPVYPNGWFRILDSMHLKKEEVKQVTAFGENLVVFRGKSGKAFVLDAYCTHMGANLAVGGRVLGDCIECPFHAWTFNGEGKCVRVPYADKVPEYGNMKSWHSHEINGNIYIWYHCENLAPQWEIPAIPEIEEGQYVYRGRVEHHINTHIRDIPENGYDEAHLQHLHLPFLLSGVNLATQFDSKLNIADQVLKTDYSRMFDSKEKHLAQIDLTSTFDLFRKMEIFTIHFKIWQVGPGVVHLNLTTSVGNIVIIQNISPVEPMDQVLTHTIYTKWYVPNVVAKVILRGVAVQVDRDLMVWNNRTFLARPLLLKEEKIQKTFRRWFQQFYTENSPRLGDTKKDALEW